MNEPMTWGDFILKASLGLLSFMALCYGGFWVIRWFTRELKESRASFLAAIDKDRDHHNTEVDKLIAAFDRGNEKILDRIDGLECAPSRERNSRG